MSRRRRPRGARARRRRGSTRPACAANRLARSWRCGSRSTSGCVSGSAARLCTSPTARRVPSCRARVAARASGHGELRGARPAATSAQSTLLLCAAPSVDAASCPVTGVASKAREKPSSASAPQAFAVVVGQAPCALERERAAHQARHVVAPRRRAEAREHQLRRVDVGGGRSATTTPPRLVAKPSVVPCTSRRARSSCSARGGARRGAGAPATRSSTELQSSRPPSASSFGSIAIAAEQRRRRAAVARQRLERGELAQRQIGGADGASRS